MSITARAVLSNEIQSDDSRHVVFEYTFHTGEKDTVTVFASADFDAAGTLVAREPLMLASREDRETSKAMSSLLIGTAASVVWNSLAHATPLQLVKKVFRAIILTDDFKVVLALEGVATYVFATYSDAQIRQGLNITQSQLNKVKNRVSSVVSTPVVLQSVKDVQQAFTAGVEDFWE